MNAATSIVASRAAPQARAGTAPISAPAGAIVVVFVVAGTALHLWLHHRTHGVVDPTHAGLSFFLVLNLLIGWWEVALLVCQDQIAAEYARFRRVDRGHELRRMAAVLARPIPLRRVFSLDQWATIWSSYSLFDPRYSDRRSFGFVIDVGNGVTTLIPAALFGLGMTYAVVPARVLGMVGLLLFWQMLYGTVMYFFQFFHNGRHRGHSPRNIVVFVGGTNAMWIVFPVWGLWACARLVLDGTYSVFL